MRQVPEVRILELVVCRDYYRSVNPDVIGPDGDVPSSLCQVKDIQRRLAEVRGMLGMLQMVPGQIFSTSLLQIGLLLNSYQGYF